MPANCLFAIIAAHHRKMPWRAYWIARGSMTLALLGILTSTALSQTLLKTIEEEIHSLVQVAKPAVVTIMAATAAEKTEDGSGLLKLFGERSATANQVKIGSGLIVSSDGFIVTKASVVRDAARIEVTLDSQQVLPAEIVALDSLRGIAMLKSSGEKLTPVQIGSITSIQPGSWVTVIGNALGMPQAVSVGVVSAIHANGMLQISATVDPGSSGSPVFDAQGRAIGIISGRMGIEESSSKTGEYFSGTTLVDPLAPMLSNLREIARHYYQTRGWLGVTVVADLHHQGRPKVWRLAKEGPAERAGIQLGDVITHFTNQPIEPFTKLREMVAASKPGDIVSLTIIRQDSVFNLEVPIGQQIPIALNELQFVPENDILSPEIKMNKPSPTMFENRNLQRRIQALEKELRMLRSLQQKQ